ncbi:MAG TPA: c-type cytochrome [Steroidobacteraceae bacterium]|nr:c-type cytochrome [Steroidobacteraceae bacterium]
MSKQDHHFFNMLSVVIGGLVAIAIVLFGIAHLIGTPFERARSEADSSLAASAAANTASPARVALAGADNRALAIVAASGVVHAALAVPANAEETFRAVCSACHATGVGGAPKVGDRAAWAPRISQGTARLTEHALKGFTGKSGVMIPKGGRSDLPDELIRETVEYMVKMSR